MSSLSSTITSSGAAITSAMTGAVGGAIVAASREGVAQAGQAWRSAGAEMAAAGQQTTVAMSAPMAAFGALTLKTAGDFEQQMNRVRAVSGATGEDFDALTALARELGETTRYSASEAADAMGFLAMAGFDTEQILSALPGTLNLAAAGAIELGEAADIASNILTGFGFDASELARINDILTATFTNSNVNMTQLGYSFKYIAPIANSAGLQFEELAAAVGMLGNAGIQGEMAGTALRGGISRLLKPTGAVSDALDELGVSVADSAGNMLPLADIFEQLESAGATTSDMITIFGLEAGPGMMALLDQGSGALRDFTADLENSGGTAERIAGIQMEGLNGSILELKSAFEGLLLAIADSGMLETVTARVESFTSVVQDLSQTNPELLNTAASFVGLLAALGPILWIGGRVVGTIGSLIAVVGGSAKFLAAAVTGWRMAGTVWGASTPLITRLTAAIRVSAFSLNTQAMAVNRSVAGMILHNTWSKIVRGATLTWTAAQWVLNSALTANPIGIVVVAIAALVGGIVLAWKRSETFRNVVTQAWDTVKAKVQPVLDWFTGTVWPGLVAGYEWVADIATRAWGKVTGAWDKLTGLFSGEVSLGGISQSLRDAGTGVVNWFRDRSGDIRAWVKDLPRMIWEGGTGLGESFLGLLQTILDPENLTRIGQDIAGHITGGLDWLIDQAQELPAKLGPKLGAVAGEIIAWAQSLPGLVEETVAGLAASLVGWAARVGPEAVARLRQAGTDIADWFKGLPGRIADLVDIDAAVAWAKEIPGRISDAIDIDAAVAWVLSMKDRAVEWLSGVGDAVAEWARGLPEKIRGWIDNAAKVKDWFIEWGPKIVAGLGIAFLVVALAIPVLLLTVAAAILFVLGIIVIELGKWIWEKFTGLMETAAQALGAKVAEVGARFREIRDQAVTYISNLHTRVTGFFANARDQSVARVRETRDRALAFFANLRDQSVARVRALRDQAVSALLNARDRGVGAVRGLRDQATALVTTARDWVVSRVTGLRDRAVTVLENFRDRAIQAFQRAKSGIETAWKQVEKITKSPITFLVNTVYNNGIRATWNKVADLVNMAQLPRINGFATGGIMPGYTPGRDPHKFISPTGGRLELSGGEAIMRPEFTRAVGPGWVHAINAAARSGGIGGVQSALGFANGGVYGGVQSFNKGGIWQSVQSFGSSLKDIFDGDGLASAARAVLDPLIATMKGRFTEGRFSELLTAVPGAMVGKLATWLKNTVGSMLGGTGKAVADAAGKYVGISGNPNQFTRAFGMPGQPWCAMFVSELISEVKAQKAYSNVRSAAVTSFANSSMDSVSSVAASRPGDLAVYSGKGPGGWQHINVIVDDNGGTIGGNEGNAVRKYSSYSSRAAKFMRPKNMATGGLWWQDEAVNSPRTTPALTELLRAVDTVKVQGYASGGTPPVGQWSVFGEHGPELGFVSRGTRVMSNRQSRKMLSDLRPNPAPVITDGQWRDVQDNRPSRRRERPNQTFNITETRKPRQTAREVMKAQADADALHPSWA
ncbi:phage tail tape measure protein [Nocardiopsis eucommiae]|uniref:Phage tail tape measure protein n=1 Tax=Nocardiopsis eucommiae TaxID=2831970 RepID=A0A975QJI5_9ACTN|nr:phage tail tape measure protein [Nocardiopsis eucommiae]